MYNLSLVNFLSTDNLELPGLLYRPKTPTKKVVLFLHGNGDSSIFYSGHRIHKYAEVITQADIAFFPFNNRGAHMHKKLKRNPRTEKEEEVNGGMYYELIRNCVEDIDGAIATLKQKGFDEFYLVGHSTGANKIVVYNKYKPENGISNYVLLAGGDDTGIYYQSMGAEKFQRALKNIPQHIARGQGEKAVLKSLIPYSMSFQSLYDTINPDGDYNIFPFYEYFQKIKLSNKKLFSEFAAIEKPTLVVYGENDEYCSGRASDCVNVLIQEIKPKTNFTFSVVPGADHSFTDNEGKVARLMVDWLLKV